MRLCLFQCQISTGKTSLSQDVEEASQTRPGMSFVFSKISMLNLTCKSLLCSPEVIEIYSIFLHLWSVEAVLLALDKDLI